MSQPDWARNLWAVQQEMDAWIKTSIARQRRIPWQGIHDEAAFIASWYGHYFATGNKQIRDFMYWLRDGYLEWAKTHLYHGYYPEGEVHHATEGYILFLARLWQVDNDQQTIDALEDAAHHVGNWVSDIPEWYDWERHLFRSWRIGSKVVKAEPPDNFNVPDHLRMVQIAFSAYLATQKARYLEICCDYVDTWCQAILREPDRIPAVLFPLTDPAEIENAYMGVSANATKLLEIERGPQEPRVELHTSAGTVDVLLDLYVLTKESRYVDAARKILRETLPVVAHPYSETPGMLFAKYRRITGDKSFDGDIMERLRDEPPYEYLSALMITDTKPEAHPLGIGRRRDEIKWGYRNHDGSIREQTEPSPSALMLGYHITHEHDWLNQALVMAATRLSLARRSLLDGRHHGDAGSTISAIASGHGRAAGAGTIVGTLYPALFGAYRFANAERLQVRYFHADGTLGLPKGVAALFESTTTDERVMYFYNGNDTDTTMQIRVEDTDSSIRQMTLNGVTAEEFAEQTATVYLKAGQITTVTLIIG